MSRESLDSLDLDLADNVHESQLPLHPRQVEEGTVPDDAFWSLSRPSERTRAAEHLSKLPPAPAATEWLAQWAVLIFASLVTGGLGSMAMVVSDWLLTIREGRCNVWYLPKTLCCEGGACAAGASDSPWTPWPADFLVFTILSAGLATLAVSLVVLLSPEAAINGIPAIRGYVCGHKMPAILSFQGVAVKIIAYCLAAGSGIWLSLEAPLVHLAASIAIDVGKRSGHLQAAFSPSGRRQLAVATAAAGMAVSVAAPVGGVLFVLEILRPVPVRPALWKAFVCAVTAVLVVEAIDPLRTGKAVVFEVSYDRVWHGVELIPFGLLGLVGGCYGYFAVLGLKKLDGIRQKFYASNFRFRFIVLPGSVAALTAILSYWSPLKQPLPELLAAALKECRPGDSTGFCTDGSVPGLAYAALVSIFLTPLSYGLGIPGGILVPALTTGALLGRLLGEGMRIFLHAHRGVLSEAFCPGTGPCITPGVYALVGAAAVLTGITKLTITSVVILFEITGALTYIVPIMAGVMIAKWVGDALSNDGAYDTKEKPTLFEDKSTVPSNLASDYMQPAGTLPKRTPDEVKEHRPATAAAVVRGSKLVGYVPPQSDTVNDTPFDGTALVSSTASALFVASTMENLGVGTVFLTKDGELEGVMDRQAAADAMHAEKQRDIEMVEIQEIDEL